MPKSSPNKTNTRRSTKNRSPLSSAKKSVKKPAKRKPRTRQVQLINLPLGRQTRLTLTVTRPKRAKKKKSKKPEVLKVAVLLLVGFSGTIFFGLKVLAAPAAPPLVKATQHQTITAPTVKKFLPRAQPTVIRIPDIQLDTTLSAVGLDKDGSIAVPAQYMTAGWYQDSPTPGEVGPSIIVGHLDNVKGAAVFWRLRELVPGRIIEIDREDSTTVRFVVDKVQQFSQGDYPVNEVYGNTAYAGLRLITCGGTFNRSSQHYDANTVVFASQVQ